MSEERIAETSFSREQWERLLTVSAARRLSI